MTALADAVARSFSADEPERPAVSPLRALGRRRLSGAELLGQTMATTAPAVSMVLLPVTMFAHETLLPGLVTIAVATLAITLIALCVARFTRRLAASGGLYTFVFQGLGARAALTCGVGLLVKYLGSAAMTMFHGGQALATVAAQLGIPLRGWGIGALYLAIALVIGGALVRGVRFAAVVILAVEACSLVFIVGLMLLADPVAVPTQVPDSSAPGVLFVGMTALFALAGFESATFFAPETRRPLVTVTRTVLATPIICGSLFIFAAWAAWSDRAGLLVNAYLDGVGPGVSPTIVILLHIGLTCSWLASSMASSNTASRIVYSMSLEGALPRWLGRVDRRWRTPEIALAAIVTIVLAGGLVFVAVDEVPANVKTVVRTALLTAYILVAVASVRFLRRIHELSRRDRWAAGLGAAMLIGTLAFLAVSEVRDGISGAYATLVTVVTVGALWHRYLRRSHPRTLSALGIFDSPESADVLPGAGRFAVNARGRVALVGADHTDIRDR